MGTIYFAQYPLLSLILWGIKSHPQHIPDVCVGCWQCQSVCSALGRPRLPGWVDGRQGTGAPSGGAAVAPVLPPPCLLLVVRSPPAAAASYGCSQPSPAGAGPCINSLSRYRRSCWAPASYTRGMQGVNPGEDTQSPGWLTGGLGKHQRR